MFSSYIIHIKLDGRWSGHKIESLKSIPSFLAQYPKWQEYQVFDKNFDEVVHKIQLLGQEVNWL